MFRLTKVQNEEKDLFQRQLLALKSSKCYLMVDLFFLVTTIICIFFSSLWFAIPLVVILYNLKNHFFDYRFNRAIALMLEQGSTFNVSQQDKEKIENFW